jgi:hypothetical protein
MQAIATSKAGQSLEMLRINYDNEDLDSMANGIVEFLTNLPSLKFLELRLECTSTRKEDRSKLSLSRTCRWR